MSDEMIRLEISEDSKKKHLEYYEAQIVPRFNWTLGKLGFSGDSKAHRKFMQFCKENAEKLAIGKPKELRKLISEIDSNYKDLFMKKFKKSKNKRRVDYREILEKIFDYETFGKKNVYQSKQTINQMNIKQLKEKSNVLEKWGPYQFVLRNNLRVCPYCNRQYITPIYFHTNEKSFKSRGELDHFYPKSKYPYLAMSIYNLIPSCSTCNSSFKGKKEFSLDDPNPYEKSYDDLFSFVATGVPGESLDIRVKQKDSSSGNFVTMFRLEELYKYHTNHAEELFKKHIMYPDSYIEELYERNKEHFASKADLRAFVMGYALQRESINDEVLGKLRIDIADQLKEGSARPNEELLKELKRVMEM